MAKCTRCDNDLPADASFCPQCALPVPAPPRAVPDAVETAGVGVGTITDRQTRVVLPPRTAAVLAEGHLFHGRYVIERKLGAGAMGVVYAAHDRTTGEAVALKLINPSLADRPAARERFVREGVTARNVRHPNVVAMYDVGETDGQVYLVMQYVHGETLRTWLHRTLQEKRDVAFETARGIVRAVLEGLAVAHAAGVVHRDLKPENVMLLGDPQAGDYRLKILDFGIARAAGAVTPLTTSSSSTGTPLYMAPEQKTAADTVGPAADLYAVTAMLYEILVGVAPEGRWGAPSRERRDLPAGIDAIVETGLSSRPRSRYQTAEEYIGVLDAVDRPVEPKEPLSPPPPPPPPPPPDPPTTSVWLRLVERSRAQSPGSWALWDRMSTPQRVVFGVVAFFAVVAMAMYCRPQTPVEGSGETGIVRPAPAAATDREGSGKAVEKAAPAKPVQISGRWSDEVAGTGFAVGYVDMTQRADQVVGPVYNMQGYQVGSFEGRVEGTSMEYTYVAANGVTGEGRAVLRADGIHLDVQVRELPSGAWVRHTLHKYHWPPQ